MKKALIRIIAAMMPTSDLRRSVRNCLTLGFGKTHYRGRKNNKIVYIDNKNKKHIVRKLPGCLIYFYGDNNYIEIHGPLNGLQLYAKMEGDSKIIIKSSQYSDRNIKVQGMKNCELNIGKDFYVNGVLLIEYCGATKINIGDDCMFSYDILIRTGDGHNIYSLDTDNLINPNENIKIGNHVWVAGRTTILKGTIIPNNSIVGACSLCNKKFNEENIVIAGVPAVIKKHNIRWER